MINEQFDDLFNRLESEARLNPFAYRFKVFLLSGLGNAYVGLIVLILLGLLAALFASIIQFKWIVAKPIGIVWVFLCLVLRPLWVRLEPPEFVLTAGAGWKGMDNELVTRINEALSGSPLALEIVGTTFRERVEQGEPPGQVLAQIVSDLQNEGLAAIDTPGLQDPSTSMLAAIETSVHRLDRMDQAMLPLLATLPSASSLTMQRIADACAISLRDAERLILRLARLSLLNVDPTDRCVRIPPLIPCNYPQVEARSGKKVTVRG